MRNPASLAIALVGALALAVLAPSPVPQPARAASAATLPADRVHFGVSSEPTSLSWMTGSGVPWRYRYTYLAGGVNTGNGWETWQWNQDPRGAGVYALDYMNNSRQAGYIPFLPYYELLQSSPASGSGESAKDLSNLNNTATMAAYYANFRLLCQRAGQFGGTVVIQVEPDLWGYLQQASGNTTADHVAASVDSSGDADAHGYPNTAQGFAGALLHIRDRYAPNAVMAIHASLWSSGWDVGSTIGTGFDAATEAGKTAAFLNSTGAWDLVTNDIDDHDAGWWEAQGADTGSFTHWWDTGPAPAADRPSFVRYLRWVSALHSGTGKPQAAWQVPVGNQHYLTMNNTCGHYQDNTAAWLLDHPGELLAAGLIAVLFGAGNACQTTNEDSQADGVTNNGGAPTTDTLGGCNACNTAVSSSADDDGGFLRERVGQYYAGQAAPDTGRPWTGGADVVGATAGAPDWYFAEGYTGANFHEYLTALDLSGAAQTVSVDYYRQDGGAVTTVPHSLAANARLTIDVNSDVGPGLSVAAHVHTLSGSNLVVERPMYFLFGGRSGGDVVMGLTAPRRVFYFAEGYTGPGFDEYLTMANPAASGVAHVKVTYYFAAGAGSSQVDNYDVAAGTRVTKFVNAQVHTAGDVSMLVESDTPLIAERPFFFSYGPGWTGGHVDSGAPAPARSLDLAEGYVGYHVDEYLTVLNPDASEAAVDFSFYDPQGNVTPVHRVVSPKSRFTLSVASVLPQGTSNSVHIESSVPVVVERPMYFSYGRGWDGGHVAVALPLPVPGTTYYFAEGYVASWIDEFLTFENPGGSQAAVHVAFHDQAGRVTPWDLVIGPHTRATLRVNDVLPAETAASAVVTSDRAILVERPTYFSF